ncbi:Arm DNA-binding domain-containing protein [Spirosoma pollinicola]|uniref:Arm DNA-binding domain-containing protein n=1 Tax=Spirosoma pollinicola TaxID=2057025 RepID=UPI0037428B15
MFYLCVTYMNLSIRFLLRKDKPGKDNLYSVHLRVTQSRKHQYLSTKHRVSIANWD